MTHLKSLAFLLLLAGSAHAAISCSPGPYPNCTHPATFTLSGTVTSAEQFTLAQDYLQCGDTIVLAAGVTFTSTHSAGGVGSITGGGIVTPRLRCDSGNRITITTSESAKLPRTDTRITMAYKPLMPLVEAATASNNMIIMSDSTTIRGLWFRPTQSSKMFDSSGVSLKIGRKPSMGPSSGGNDYIGYIVDMYAYDAKTAGAVTANTTNQLPLNRVDTFDVGDKIGFNPAVGTTCTTGAGFSGTLSPAYTWTCGFRPSWQVREAYVITAINAATKTVTLDTSSSPSGFIANAVASGTPVYLVMDRAEHQPTNVTITQNIFTNDSFKHHLGKHISADGRRVDIENNFMADPLVQLSDSQNVSCLDCVGPINMRNNHMSGATENWMSGGGPTALGGPTELLYNGGLHDFNYFAQYHERTRIGPYFWMNDQARQPSRTVWKGKIVVPSHLINNASSTSYVKSFTSQSTVTILASEHGKGTYPTVTSCSPLPTGGSTVNGDITIAFASAVTGSCTVTTQKRWYMANNTGDTCATEPAIALWEAASIKQAWNSTDKLGQTVSDCGVTWELMYNGDNSYKLVKNDYELKWGSNITIRYNMLDGFAGMFSWNGTQSQIMNLKALGENCVYSGSTHNATTTVGGTPAGMMAMWHTDNRQLWPAVTSADLYNINVQYNYFRTQAGGINVVPGQFCKPRTVDNINIRHNYIEVTEDPFDSRIAAHSTTSARFLFSQLRGAPGDDPFALNQWQANQNGSDRRYDTSSQKYEHNTWNLLAPTYGHAFASTGSYICDPVGNGTIGPNGMCGNNAVRGNIMFTSGTSGVKEWGNQSTPMQVFPCGLAPTTACPAWEKNVFLGARTFSGTTRLFPADTITGCPSTTVNCTPNYLFDYRPNGNEPVGDGILFRDKAAGSLTVRNTHPWKRAIDGEDVGADMSQIPMIRNLKVTASASQVLFDWDVTNPIGINDAERGWRDIPCVIEVHTSPDFENDFKDANGNTLTGVYAGELGQAGLIAITQKDSAGNNRDSSEHSMWVKYGLHRTLGIGYTVPLTASTRYFYRLSCGGALTRGEFTTSAPVTGTTSLTHSFRAPLSGDYVLRVGYSYDRSTDLLSNTLTDGTPVTCTAGETCSVSASVNRGYRYGFRWVRTADNVKGRAELTIIP